MHLPSSCKCSLGVAYGDHEPTVIPASAMSACQYFLQQNVVITRNRRQAVMQPVS